MALAAGQPIAPFFRFTGLGDSDPLLAYLHTRSVASFTGDVVWDDSYIGDPRRLAQVTLQRIEARQGGIVLFHDIKVATAKALPRRRRRLQGCAHATIAQAHAEVESLDYRTRKPAEVHRRVRHGRIRGMAGRAVRASGGKKRPRLVRQTGAKAHRSTRLKGRPGNSRQRHRSLGDRVPLA